MVNETPQVPAPVASQPSNSGVKSARPDIIDYEESRVPAEVLQQLLFENLAGQEIINIARNDTVTGQNVSYSLISNIDELNIRYNSKNIFNIPGSSEAFFSSFPIRLEVHSQNELGEEPYIDENGDLVINVTLLNDDEQVEIQTFNSGSLVGDTIYMEEES